jgi:F0F1-type ATP synthase beta subunit
MLAITRSRPPQLRQVSMSMANRLTMAEYFRDDGRDVLMFIDNIYRQAQRELVEAEARFRAAQKLKGKRGG